MTQYLPSDPGFGPRPSKPRGDDPTARRRLVVVLVAGALAAACLAAFMIYRRPGAVPKIGSIEPPPTMRRMIAAAHPEDPLEGLGALVHLHHVRDSLQTLAHQLEAPAEESN